MIITGGKVFIDGEFQSVDIKTENGLIVEIGKKLECGKEDERIQVDGDYVIPGLVDIHTHGAVSYDFSDGAWEGLLRIAEYEAAVGVTSFCPTTMTISPKELRNAFLTGRKVVQYLTEKENTDSEKVYAHILGFHMEGPFINPEKKGAQNEKDILLPDLTFFHECQSVSGEQIRIVTIAPETAGAMEFIREAGKETVCSVGHTMADEKTASLAFAAGANHVTHLFNAMPPFSHRAPGVVGAALDADDTVVELITDGVHIHESMIRAAFAMFPGRVALISDSIRATGLSDGNYILGGQEVKVSGNLGTLSDGTIAGSVTNLFDCMRYAISIGIPLEDAIAAATIIPARSIGCADKVGSIEVGKRADFVVMGQDLSRKRVLCQRMKK